MNLFRRDGRPLVIGHRGAAAVALENTLEALEAAVAAGADLVEFDVGAGLLLAHPGQKPAGRPLTFDDALAYLASCELGIHVDLKQAGLEPEVVAIVRKYGLDERVVVSSTSAWSLRRLARVAPELPRVIAYPNDRYGVSRIPWPRLLTAGGAAGLRSVMPLRVPLLLAAAGANALALHHALVSPSVVRATHARGAAIFAWTANDPALVERLAGIGVDAIVSDNPQMAFDVLATLNRL